MKMKSLAALGLSIALIAAGTSAHADEGNLNQQVEDSLVTQLELQAEDAGMSVTLENMTVNISQELIDEVGTTDPDVIAAYILNYQADESSPQALPTASASVTIWAWEANRSWTEIKRNSTCVATSMKGTMSALVRGSFVSTAATFLASDKLSGDRMVGVLYTEC